MPPVNDLFTVAHRLGANDLTVRAGEVLRLSYRIDKADSQQADFQIGNVTATIYNAAGAAIVSGAAGDKDSNGAASFHDIWYLFNTGGPPAVPPGDYSYLISFVVGEQTRTVYNTIAVLASFSLYDRYVGRLIDWIIESEMGEVQRFLSTRQLRGSVDAAVNAYEAVHPQLVQATVPMAAGVFEYALPTDWVAQFSELEQVEYPVNDAVQDRFALDAAEYAVDELRGKWRFTGRTPQAGETARLTYTTEQNLTDSTDTLPPADFETITQYAAGVALMQLANAAAGTSAPNVAADVVQYRTKQQEYRSQAEAMMKASAGAWTSSASRRPFEVWSYLPNHGRLYPAYSVWG